MNYWQIVLTVLAGIGIAAVVIACVWATVAAFEDDNLFIGWLMTIIAAAGFIFGVPWLIMAAA